MLFRSTKDVQNKGMGEDNAQEVAKKYSSEDMPRQAQTKRKIYDEIMGVIEEFFEKEKAYDMFLKLRAYIKKHFNE